MWSAATSTETQDQSSANADAIVWTLFMMDRILNGIHKTPSSIPLASISLPTFQGDPLADTELDDMKQLQLQTIWKGGAHDQYIAIVTGNIELLEIWEMVVADTGQIKSEGNPRFWNNGSSWRKIHDALLDFELSKPSI
jgi:hypothetical protein